MDRQLHCLFRNMPPSIALEKRAKERAHELERLYDHIISCRITFKFEHPTHGGEHGPDVHLLVQVPGDDIIVARQTAAGEDGFAALKHAFEAAAEQLRAFKGKHHGAGKVHAAHEARPGRRSV